jgi:HSP20 family protein
MSEKKEYTFDLGRMMDEAFKVAQEFSESFGREFAKGFPSAEDMRARFREHFKWHDWADFYPYYSYPPTNIYLAKDGSLNFEFALAGFAAKDIDLQFRGDYLYFSAKAPQEAEQEEGVQYFKRRLKLKSVEEQRFYVPEDRFDREGVQARFHSGLLQVTIPARGGAAKTQGIKVDIVDEEPPERMRTPVKKDSPPKADES